MFQDLPPVKGAVDPSALPLPPGAIPLKQVQVIDAKDTEGNRGTRR